MYLWGWGERNGREKATLASVLREAYVLSLKGDTKAGVQAEGSMC